MKKQRLTVISFSLILLALLGGLILCSGEESLAAEPGNELSLGSRGEGMGIAMGPALGGVVAKSYGLTASIIVSTILLAAMSCFYFLYPVEKFFFRQM
jgi:predicted MFS family arabinose efflux permease